jgi:hypothetical protein
VAINKVVNVKVGEKFFPIQILDEPFIDPYQGYVSYNNYPRKLDPKLKNVVSEEDNSPVPYIEDEDGDGSVGSYPEEELVGFDFTEEDLSESVLLDHIIQNQKQKLLKACNVELIGVEEVVSANLNASVDVKSVGGACSNHGLH